jgi:hypothetical protein
VILPFLCQDEERPHLVKRVDANIQDGAICRVFLLSLLSSEP